MKVMVMKGCVIKKMGLYPDFVKKAFNLYSEKERIMQHAFTVVKYGNVVGDYLEFGVWKGNSFITAYKTAKSMGLNSMRFYGFDSFQGLPETSGIDMGSVFKQGDFVCTEEQFKGNLRHAKVDMDKVVIVNGWFDKVLNSELRNSLDVFKASVILIDSDLYSSARFALDFITPFVQDGTIVLFDDWFCFGGSPFCGERRAFSEWLKKNPNFIVSEFYKFHTLGNSFILHLKEG